MGKPEQFLWVVQTLMLRNAINLAADPERLERYRHEISATGAFGTCQDALWASERIPSNMSAAEAAHEFFFYMADNLRDQDEKAEGKRPRAPGWFARG